MQKETRRVAWSTERKYVRRYKGTFDIFFGVEHRMRKEVMDEQLVQQRGQERTEFCS